MGGPLEGNNGADSMHFTKRLGLFRTKRKAVPFREGFIHGGQQWRLHPHPDDPRIYVGWIAIQGRRIRLEVHFPKRFPFEEPLFTFPDRNVTHPYVEEQSGRMERIWLHTWSPEAADADYIMQGLLDVLSQYSVKGKEPG